MKSLHSARDGRSRPARRPRLQEWLIIVVTAAPSLAAAGGDARIIVVDGSTTVRRVLTAHGGAGAGASLLANGAFTEGLDAWRQEQSGGSAAPGGVLAEDGAAVLREGDSFLVTLSQEFQLPPGARRLSFAVRLEPGFDRTAASIPDAFEVSLLDTSLASVVGSWSDQATSFLNFQESGAVNAGPGVVWDGERASVDLAGAAADRAVTIFFDLIGVDSDVATSVRLDDVVVTVGEGFVRGDPNIDGDVNITDPIVILNYLFLGTSALRCLDAADTNDDGALNITDPIFLLGYLFLGTEAIPAPFPSCGLDEGPEDGLDCGPCSCPATAGEGDCP